MSCAYLTSIAPQDMQLQLNSTAPAIPLTLSDKPHQTHQDGTRRVTDPDASPRMFGANHIPDRTKLGADLIEMFCCRRIRQNSAMNNAHLRIPANPLHATRASTEYRLSTAGACQSDTVFLLRYGVCLSFRVDCSVRAAGVSPESFFDNQFQCRFLKQK